MYLGTGEGKSAYLILTVANMLIIYSTCGAILFVLHFSQEMM